MKFLIQKIDGKITHDFSLTLLESIRFQKWLDSKNKITIKYLNTNINETIIFKSIHKKYIPIGSVEFVTTFLQYFYNKIPMPINIPTELFNFTYRNIFNGTEKDIKNIKGKWFIKNNDKIKDFSEIIDINENTYLKEGNYQFSQFIQIQSEWRVFIYKGKLVGLQNYSGDFTKFPNVDTIKGMVLAYKNAPISYTLDIGVTDYSTFVIECHDFFSCGLYGFNDYTILPFMFSKWFYEYLNK